MRRWARTQRWPTAAVTLRKLRFRTIRQRVRCVLRLFTAFCRLVVVFYAWVAIHAAVDGLAAQVADGGGDAEETKILDYQAASTAENVVYCLFCGIPAFLCVWVAISAAVKGLAGEGAAMRSTISSLQIEPSLSTYRVYLFFAVIIKVEKRINTVEGGASGNRAPVNAFNLHNLTIERLNVATSTCFALQ